MENMTPKRLTRLPQILAGLLFGERSHQESSRTAAATDKPVALPTLGVFIDFDNVNGAAIPLVFQHLSSRWNATWRRAYGTGLAKHGSILHASGILPVEVVPNTRRKNSADIALVIDVMLAVCSDSVEAFCIVSSDGDYTRLALTLREKGKRLLIAGRSTTPSSLRAACTEFINLDDLSSPSPQASVRSGLPSIAAASEAEGSAFSAEAAATAPAFAPHVAALQLPSREAPSTAQLDAEELIPLIRELTVACGKTTLSAIQIECSRHYTDFSPRMCGAPKWRPLLQRMGVFTVEPIEDKNGKIKDYAVSLRPEALAPEVPTDEGDDIPR
jgi:hypothetical protein